MHFRTAKIDDLITLNEISFKSKAYWGYPDEWMEKWKDDLTMSEEEFFHSNILVVEVENRIIGFSSIVENAENYELNHLWLLPEIIGKGVGKKLLNKTIEIFVKAEKPIILLADPNAEAFYSSQGFVTFDKLESFPKERFLPLMRKHIQYN